MSKEQELLRLKKEIEDAKSEISEYKGRKTQLTKQLKDDWDCTTTKQSEDKLVEMEKKLASLNTQFNEGVEKLEQEMNQ